MKPTVITTGPEANCESINSSRVIFLRDTLPLFEKAETELELCVCTELTFYAVFSCTRMG